MPEWAVCLLRTCLAVALGCFIGFERKMRFKEAGMRTHSIVCAGACIFMLVSKYGFADSADFDASRVAAQIVSGIGFLGAGVIMYRKNTLHNLTTAAGIWATAGIGMASGAGLYILACGGTAIIVFVQFIMHSRLKIFRVRQNSKLRISFRYSEECAGRIKDIFEIDDFKNLNSRREGGEMVCTVVLNLEKEIKAEDILAIMDGDSDIISIDRADDEI